MNDKLIEAVARALYDYGRPDYDPDFSEIDTSIKEQMEGCARAALDAIHTACDKPIHMTVGDAAVVDWLRSMAEEHRYNSFALQSAAEHIEHLRTFIATKVQP